MGIKLCSGRYQVKEFGKLSGRQFLSIQLIGKCLAEVFMDVFDVPLGGTKAGVAGHPAAIASC
jgi:hypothetical protein